VLLQLSFHFGDGFLGGIMIPMHIGFFLAQLLPGKKLDDFAAGFRGLFDGLKHAEAVEGIRLAAYGETAGFILVGDLDFAAEVERHEGQDCEGGNTKELR
jgi:hypothetical protein